MRSTQLKEWRTASGLTARVIENNLFEEGALVPPAISQITLDISYWVNGYVGVGIDHPLYQQEYNDAGFGRAEPERYLEVHGGLTFSGKMEDSDLWWFGFDTNHCNDGPHTKNEQYVSEQCEELARQLAEYMP